MYIINIENSSEHRRLTGRWIWVKEEVVFWSFLREDKNTWKME
jgi:hypothetical protein